MEAAIGWQLDPQWQLQLGVNAGWLRTTLEEGLQPRLRIATGFMLAYSPFHTLMLFVQSFLYYRTDSDARPVVGAGFSWWPVPSSLAIYVEIDAGVQTPDFPPLFDVGAAWMW